MAEYNIISQSLWHSEKFKALKTDQFSKLVFLYLVNSPHSNSCGCYPIHIGYIMADLNCTETEVKEAIESLTQRLLIQYNYDENTVLIPNFMQHNPPRNPNHAIKVFNESLSIPCKKFRSLRMQELQQVVKDKGWKLPKEKIQILESLTPSLPLTMTKKSTPNPTQPNSTHYTEPKGSSCSEAAHPQNEPEKQTEIEPKKSTPRTSTYLSPDGRFYSFNKIIDVLWDEYPKIRANRGKEKFGDQIEIYLKKNGSTTPDWEAAILNLATAIRKYADYINETGELQPDPWRWMRDKGYEDEYEFTNQPTTKGASNDKRDDIGAQAATLLDKLAEG